MAEFTLFELHFEDGSIPAVGGLASDEDDPGTDGGGHGLGLVVLAVVALAVGIALARKLRDEGDINDE